MHLFIGYIQRLYDFKTRDRVPCNTTIYQMSVGLRGGHAESALKHSPGDALDFRQVYLEVRVPAASSSEKVSAGSEEETKMG